MSTLLTVQTWRREAEAKQLERMEDPGMRFLQDNHNGGMENFRDSTYLYIKAMLGDMGDRPIPKGTIFWNSPHIELFEGTTPIPTNELKAGQNYRVEVTISNGGDLEGLSCSVDLYICNPSLGFNVSAGRLIGLLPAEVGPHATTKVMFNFTATAADIGHRCLFARVSSVSTKDYPADASAFNTVDDRHIGQQNLSIVKQGEMLFVDLAPLLQANFEVSLVRNNTIFKQFKRYAAFKNIKTSNKGQQAEFKMLEVNEAVKTEKNQQTLIKKITPISRDIFSAPKPSPQPVLLNKLGKLNLEPKAEVPEILNQVRPLPAIKKNKWQFNKPGEALIFKRTLLMVPNLGLKPNEAVTYLLQMKDKQGRTIGGITLVITS